MIPKIMHVVWVGNSPMPEKEAYCLSQNRKILSEYDFYIWNEDNIGNLIPDIDAIKNFIDYATKAKKWAFVSDIVKALALTRIGGWSIDADNEFLSDPAPFSRMHWVSGFENWNGILKPITAVMGAVPQHKFSKVLLDVYMKNSPEQITSMPNTTWISTMLVQMGATMDNTRQYIDACDVQLFPDHVFCGPPKPGATVALHHFSGSWCEK